MLGSSIENEEESALGVRAVGLWGRRQTGLVGAESMALTSTKDPSTAAQKPHFCSLEHNSCSDSCRQTQGT